MRLENQVYSLYAFECNGTYGEQALLNSDVYLTVYIIRKVTSCLFCFVLFFLQSWKIQESKYSTKSISGLAG